MPEFDCYPLSVISEQAHDDSADLDKELPIDKVDSSDEELSVLPCEKLAENIVENTQLDDDSDAHLVHQKLHENIIEAVPEESEAEIVLQCVSLCQKSLQIMQTTNENGKSSRCIRIIISNTL